MPQDPVSVPHRADDAPILPTRDHLSAGGELLIRPGPPGAELSLVVNAAEWRAGDILLYSRSSGPGVHAIARAQDLAGFPSPASDVIHVGLVDGAGHVWDISLLEVPQSHCVGNVFEASRAYSLRRPFVSVEPRELVDAIAIVRRDFYTINLPRLLFAVADRIAARTDGLPRSFDPLSDSHARTMTLCTTWLLRCLTALDIEILMDVELPLPADFFECSDLDEAPLVFFRM